MHLAELQSPAALKELSYAELSELATEIREKIVNTVAQRGGHLASNLGVVELTLALHRVFDMPEDKLVFDVGHQSYVHKLLTGRCERFDTLRSYGGLSGFPKRGESEYDVFETGHASTAISAALGLARARDYQGKHHNVLALVGDGALTGGMCYEALNDAGNSSTRLIVILNDNEMSIAPNVGAMSRYLTSLRVSKRWRGAKKRVKSRLMRIPLVGKHLYKGLDWLKDTVKSVFMQQEQQNEGFFTSLGFHYYGPIDGHDLRSMERVFQEVRDADGPVVVHVLTRKGHGYEKAEEMPEIFHGTPPFFVETGETRKTASLPSFGQVMAEELSAMAEEDSRIVAITAAMPSGTGLQHFQEKHPQRMLDVGIAEEHAVTLAAGLAAGGMKPYFAVYATFFQRSFDQMIHDVCLQRLPVTFLLDRAGLVGEDGETHHGVYDLASMLPIPNLTILAPRDLQELRQMLRWTQRHDGPVAIRYGRSAIDMSSVFPAEPFVCGRWERLIGGGDCTLLATGAMVREAAAVSAALAQQGIQAEVINCSTVKPLDEAMLRELSNPVFTMEEHACRGGFGESVCAFRAIHGLPAPVHMFGVPDRFVPHGKHSLLMAELGLTAEQMAEVIRKKLQKENDHER